MSKIIDAIMKMDRNELSTIRDAVKLRYAQLSENAVLSLKVGDSVSFKHNGKTLMGLVTKLNRKTVGVKAGYTNWTISPGLLKRVTT